MGDDPVQIPGYRVRRELGRGASGVVYLAEEAALGREVALKVLNAPVAHVPEVRARFEREIKSASRVRHPGIVPVLAAGEAGGRLWYTMELVEGPSLDRVLAESGTGRLPMGRAARIALETARILAAAHRAGVTHRDVKPANVALLTEPAPALEASSGTRRMLASWVRSGGRARGEPLVDRPRLMDFGLASDAAEARLSESGMLIGTPGYMAPEQFRGRSGEVGPASDQWALGVLLYECLTGRLPFPTDDLPTLARLVAEDDPIPPSRLDPRIDRDLETIVLTCLAKAPRERYASCDALVADLEAWLREEPIAAKPPGLARRARTWARRHPRLTTALAALLLALVAGGAILARVDHVERRRVDALAQEARAAEAASRWAQAEERYGAWLAADPLAEEARAGRERAAAVRQALLGEQEAEQAFARVARLREAEAEAARLAALALGGGTRDGRAVLGLGQARGSEPWWMREPAWTAAQEAARRTASLLQEHAAVEAALAEALVRVETAAALAGAEGARVLAKVRQGAARWHMDEWRQALARGDAAQAARQRLAVESLDPEPHRAELQGHGRLVLAPPRLAGRAWLFRSVREADVLPRGGAREVPVPADPARHGAPLPRAPEAYAALLRARLADEGSRPSLPDLPSLSSPVPDDGLNVGTAEGALRRERYAALRDGTAYPLGEGAEHLLGDLAGGRTLVLEPGRYLVLWRTPGRADLRLPVAVPRLTEVRLDVPEPPWPEEIPPGFVHVSAGPAHAGPDAPIVGPFLAARLELTFAEYWEFLDDPRTREEIARRQEAPAEPGASPPWRFVPRDAEGPLTLPLGGRGPREAGFEPLLNPSRPLAGVSLHDLVGHLEPPRGEATPLDSQVAALASDLLASRTSGWCYLAWRTERSRERARRVAATGVPEADVARGVGPDGRPQVRALRFSLPTEAEWLRLAGAGDGRAYAFGDEADWGLFKGDRSRRTNATAEPVGLFPDDESPFGVRDVTGSVAEWTATWIESSSTFAVRGGSWQTPSLERCRLSARSSEQPSSAPPAVGLRLIVRTQEVVP